MTVAGAGLAAAVALGVVAAVAGGAAPERFRTSAAGAS